MRTRFAFFCLSAFLALGSLPEAAGEIPPAPAPAVTVNRDGDKVSIEMQVVVPVPVAIAWAVLTDFDQMARFIPNLSASAAVSEGRNLLRVTQKGTANWGPFGFDFESVRRITLHPMSRIEATALSGKISRMTSVSELRPTNGGVDIRYRADGEIDFWLPPLLGTSAMRKQTQQQFEAMVAEMLRRNAGR